ncbi:MAG: RNA polymerase sigma factor [Proteobacteria bacterium]|nr:RNA polymerase sigma factor [Pseudomonadota bacterium]HQR03551.1 RNA polymerase sigma factor [Rhodocyclaceae bacterium]
MPDPSRQTRPSISSQATDAELVSQAVRGEGAAFEAIMRRYNRLLFRTARSILKSDVEAEDALQEAYLRAWRALGGFRSEARLSTWLVRIVVNEALARLDRKAARIIPLDTLMNTTDPELQVSLTGNPAQQPENMAMRSEFRRLLEARIDLLPEVFRTVFMLRAVEEMSVEEVSQALEIPEATVRTRFFRARSLLREGLASQVDMALDEAFSFDGARCDRIVLGVLERAQAEGLATKNDG